MVPKWPKTANGPLWPKMALHGPKWCFNEVPLWPKMTLHDPKCPCMTPNGPKTFLGAYYITSICQLDHHGAFSETLWGHVGLWNGPRVVQHDMISCNILKRSVLRPLVVMQGYFGSWRAIFGHKGPFLVLFSAIMRPRGPLKRAQGGPTWHTIMLYTHGKCLGSFGVMQCRDGISVKNSTDEHFSPKIAHKMRILRHLAIRAKTA